MSEMDRVIQCGDLRPFVDQVSHNSSTPFLLLGVMVLVQGCNIVVPMQSAGGGENNVIGTEGVEASSDNSVDGRWIRIDVIDLERTQ